MTTAAPACLSNELTFLASGEVAEWVDPSRSAAPGEIERMRLAQPDALGRVRRRSVPVRRHRLADLVEPLLAVPPGTAVSPSGAVVAAVARLSLGAIADARVVPQVRGDGAGSATAWTVGPWTESEAADLVAIAAAVPPVLRCEPVADRPLRLRGALETVLALANGFATAIVATSASHSQNVLLPDERASDLEERLVGRGPVVVARVELTDGGAQIGLGVRHRRDYSARVTAAQIWASPSECTIVGVDQPDLWLARRLRVLAGAWAPFGRLLDDAAPDTVWIDDDELVDLVLEQLDVLRRHDVDVLLPRELVRSLEVSATVTRSASESGEASGAFSLAALCDVSLGASIDGEPLTEAELEAVTASQAEIVRLRDRFVRVDPRLAGRLRRRLTAAEVVSAALGGSVDLDDGSTVGVRLTAELDALAERVRGLRIERDVEAVPGLEADLRPYQSRGVSWLHRTLLLTGGGILADDMGLGKTLQVIAVHLLRQGGLEQGGLEQGGLEQGALPTLVVGPASLVTNWRRELERFAPSVRSRAYQGAGRDLTGLADGEVVVTTYATMRIDHEVLAQQRWGLVVADEAQHVKNHRSATAVALRALPADARVAVTGTPVENRLADLWALMDWAVPGWLGTRTGFRRRFSLPIEREGSDEAAETLGTVVAPLVLRRTKLDPTIAPDLPPRTEVDHLVVLTAEQAGLYRAFTAEIMEQIERSDGIERRGLVLKLLTGLKQICDHPALWLDQPGPLAGRSGKLAAFDELSEEMLAAGDGVLVFTQYVQMGRLLGEHLSGRGVDSVFLHGGVSGRRRQEMIDDFQAGTGPRMMLISIKAGGTGLNLTAASQVLHYDRWWNPAVENQASDRAWRIGQTRHVFVHRFTAEGTVEERIGSELARKAALASSVVGSGEGWLGDLDDDSLRHLVSLGSRDG